MQRVKSHDLSQDESTAVSNTSHDLQQQGGTEIVTSPLGAGLPLLSRLRLVVLSSKAFEFPY